MESKKLGGKMRSSLHKMMGISFSKCSMSFFVMTVEVRFLKKMLISVKACQTFPGSNSRNVMGISLYINTWKS